MNFVVQYGISILLTAIVWSVFILDPGAEIAAVAIVVTIALAKDKYDESKD